MEHRKVHQRHHSERLFFGRYIWRWNPAWGWSQWKDEGCLRQHRIAIPPHHQGSHIRTLDQDLRPRSWNLRAGKEEETKQISFVAGELAGRWLWGGRNTWIHITFRWLNTLFRVCMYRSAGYTNNRAISATHAKDSKGIRLYKDDRKDAKDSLRKDEAMSLGDVDCLRETDWRLRETCTLLLKDVVSFRLWCLYVFPKTPKTPKDGPAVFLMLRIENKNKGNLRLAFQCKNNLFPGATFWLEENIYFLLLTMPKCHFLGSILPVSTKNKTLLKPFY